MALEINYWPSLFLASATVVQKYQYTLYIYHTKYTQNEKTLQSIYYLLLFEI